MIAQLSKFDESRGGSLCLCLPVIMATTAYVTGAELKWRRGLLYIVRQITATAG
jgi:hypothetical protein